MKKIISLLLVGVICLCFVACDNNTENDNTKNNEENNTEISDNKNEIVGVWKDSDNNYIDFTFTINDDNTGLREIYDNQSENKNILEKEFTWKYSDDLDCYLFLFAGNDIISVYIENNDENNFSFNSSDFDNETESIDEKTLINDNDNNNINQLN